MEYNELDFRLIGRRVRDFRTNYGLMQEKLAEAAEISFPYVSNIEHGERKISISTFIKLAAALDVPLIPFYWDGSPMRLSLSIPR